MKYKTVVIDSPWPIKINNPPKSMEGGCRLRTEIPYKVSSMSDILSFPIDDYAAEDCQLFIWVTTGKAEDIPTIHHAFHMLERWGFTYHQLITWVKTSGFAMFSPIRSMTEHVIYGYRGKLAEGYNCMNNVFTTSQMKHSEKPARFYQLLRAWTPPPRIDIFARNAHEGFDGWGDEYVGEGALAPYLKEK